MMTVKQVSDLTGVSIRTLQYYDKTGLLSPAAHTEAGYRLYDDTALERLQQILLFRELEFPLKDIKAILDSPDFDRNKALQQQIELLELKKEHLENLITFARGLKMIGVKAVNFKAFDTSKLDEYSRKAKETWGNTPAYKEYEEKAKDRTKDEDSRLAESFMELFAELGGMRGLAPEDEKVQAQIKRIQDFITENLYTCTDDILRALGKMYSGGGEMTENIDEAGGKGTAELASKAIEIYCSK
ncbi:MAG: MerR family transcriptional regulator [Ruminococcus sp.]|nr:MerR family transcriptional regulator [Ruminococcus sp.]